MASLYTPGLASPVRRFHFALGLKATLDILGDASSDTQQQQSKKKTDGNKMNRNEMLTQLSQIEEYPLFASLNKARLEERTFEEWLNGLPAELLEEYAEHPIFDDERTKEEELKDQDYLVTVTLLHSIATNNVGINEDKIPSAMDWLQKIICALSINKEMENSFGQTGLIVHLKIGTWDKFLDVHLRANPNIEFVEENKKST